MCYRMFHFIFSLYRPDILLSLSVSVYISPSSRSMWMYILNRYFETVMADLLPVWFQEFPFPASLITTLKIILFLIDWAHTFLPIYILLEWLLTTFPAKEEQMTMRENIQELIRLREYSQKQQREVHSKRN